MRLYAFIRNADRSPDRGTTNKRYAIDFSWLTARNFREKSNFSLEFKVESESE